MIARAIYPGVLLVAAFCVSIPALVHAQANCVPAAQWYLPAQQRSIAANALFANITKSQSKSKYRVVLLGEHHDNVDHHRWQLHTVAALAALRPKITLGLEMVPRRLQPVLDRWTQGALSEEELVKQLDWETIWSFDVQYYLPLFHLARLQHIPLLALNAERSLFTRVTQEGWDAVPEQQREGITAPAPASKEYLRFLAGSFMGHNPQPDSGEAPLAAEQGQKFLRFVQGQQLWDRAMAEAIAQAVRADKETLVVALMGSWHIANRHGVPYQLQHLKISDVAVWVPWDTHIECTQLDKNFADAVFGFATPASEDSP